MSPAWSTARAATDVPIGTLNKTAAPSAEILVTKPDVAEAPPIKALPEESDAIALPASEPEFPT